MSVTTDSIFYCNYTDPCGQFYVEPCPNIDDGNDPDPPDPTNPLCCGHHHHDHIGKYHFHKKYIDCEHPERNSWIYEVPPIRTEPQNIIFIHGDGFNEFPVNGSKARYLNKFGLVTFRYEWDPSPC
jgi:hypothetical protein